MCVYLLIKRKLTFAGWSLFYHLTANANHWMLVFCKDKDIIIDRYHQLTSSSSYRLQPSMYQYHQHHHQAVCHYILSKKEEENEEKETKMKSRKEKKKKKQMIIFLLLFLWILRVRVSVSEKERERDESYCQKKFLTIEFAGDFISCWCPCDRI